MCIRDSPEGGIYIQGGDINMNGQTYTLEFIQPVKLVAKIDGEEKTEGTWRSSNKHLVSVDPDGTIVMRDGVGGYDVEITWSFEGTVYSVNFHTGQTSGAHSIEVDRPMTRGDFLIRLADYFGWYHYNGVKMCIRDRYVMNASEDDDISFKNQFKLTKEDELPGIHETESRPEWSGLSRIYVRFYWGTGEGCLCSEELGSAIVPSWVKGEHQWDIKLMPDGYFILIPSGTVLLLSLIHI